LAFRETSASGVEPTSTPTDLVDMTQLAALLRQNYRFVLWVGLCTFCLVMAITLVTRPQFRAGGRLYLGELDAKSHAAAPSSEEIDLSGGTQSDVWSEVEIITSRALVSRAISSSGLNVDIAPYGQRPVREWRWLTSRRDPALLDVAQRELRASDARLSDGVRSERIYRVRFSSDTSYELWSDSQKLGQGQLGEPLKVPELTLTLLKGLERSPKAGSDYELTVSSLDEVVERTLKALDATVPKAASTAEPVKVVSLSFSETSPRKAAAFLDALMRSYLDERRAWKSEDASAAETFVSNQLESMRTSLDQIQSKLADYRSNNRAVVLDNEAKALIEQVGKYEEQRVAARLQVAALSDVKRALKSPNPPLGAYMLGEADDTVLAEMAASLSKARQKLTDLDARFNSIAPEVKEQHAQVDGQLEAIRNYVSSRLARAQENQGALGSIISQFEAKLKTVPSAEIGLAQLSRESEVYSRLYSYLLERQQQTAIVKASTVSKNRVLDAPEPTRREDSPKLLLRLASGPLGLLLGALGLVLRNLLGVRFQSDVELRRSLSALPSFANVPKRRRKAGKRRGADFWLDPRASPGDWELEESFRTLRTNLYFFRPGELPKVVLITSPSTGDGKTTCALALASLLAADQKMVLVVDADLRKPRHRVGFGGASERSLQHALWGQCDWREAVHRVPTSFGEFHSIGASEASSPELLSGEPMARFLDEARACYDFVLLDAPAFPGVSDALVLAQASDCVLSVLRVHNTSRRATVEHVRRLSIATKNLAIVVNEASAGAARARPGDSSRPGSNTPVRSSLAPEARARSVRVVACVLVAALTAVLAHETVDGAKLWREASTLGRR
jgi:tyrosine-protein kinase Etk/Wzc